MNLIPGVDGLSAGQCKNNFLMQKTILKTNSRMASVQAPEGIMRLINGLKSIIKTQSI